MNEVRRLREVAEATVGFVGKMTPHYRSEGVMFLRSQDVRPYRIETASARRVDPAFEATIQKSRLRAGDVVVVRTGKPGTSAVVPPELEGANCSDLVVIRPGKEISPQWLSYYVNAAAQGYVQERLVGAVQQHFNVKSALEMPIPRLARSSQDAMAEVLGALDDKIAANGRAVSAADALIEAGISKVLSEEVPLWCALNFTFGEAFKGEEFSEPGTGRPLVRIRDLTSQRCQVWTTERRPRELEVLPGDVLVGMDAEFRATRWSGPVGVLNQRVMAASSSVFGPAITREVLKLPLRRIERSKSGTTVIHLNKRDLQTEAARVPHGDSIPHLRAAVDPLWLRAVSAEQESVKLAATRDELLPLLMSGRITVKDAEKTVEEVV